MEHAAPAAEHEQTADDHGVGEHAHPGPREYIKIAIVLAVVTAIEIALFYIEGLSDAVVTWTLIALMIIKFALVGLWFMHLKFDSPIFMRLFAVGLGLAVLVFGVVLLTFGASFLFAISVMALGAVCVTVAAIRPGS
jgi:cytochrome c oxidase subunit IV